MKHTENNHEKITQNSKYITQRLNIDGHTKQTRINNTEHEQYNNTL